MYATYDKALKIHYANVINAMHIDRLQNEVSLVVILFRLKLFLQLC